MSNEGGDSRSKSSMKGAGRGQTRHHQLVFARLPSWAFAHKKNGRHFLESEKARELEQRLRREPQPDTLWNNCMSKREVTSASPFLLSAAERFAGHGGAWKRQMFEASDWRTVGGSPAAHRSELAGSWNDQMHEVNKIVLPSYQKKVRQEECKGSASLVRMPRMEEGKV